MAQQIEKVRPGDLISANLMNSFMDKLISLEDRIAVLEAAGPDLNAVIITDFSPAGTLRVGDILEINGKNFSVPAVNNAVTVGGVSVPVFRFGSTDSKLIFDIPDVTGLDPTNGTSVPVTVTNSNGAASKPLILKPALKIPHGRIEVVYDNPPVLPFGDQNIIAGTYVFGFSITTFVDLDATYTLTPTATGSGSWAAELLEDSSDQPRSSNQITMPGNVGGEQRDLRLRVTVPSGQPDGTIGTLALAAIENTTGSNVTPGNEQIQITIGSPPPTPETRVRVTLRSADLGAQIVGGKVQFTRNSPGRVRFTILFTEGGDYAVTALVRNSSGWSAADIDLPTFTVTNPSSGSTTNQNINVGFVAGGTATATDIIFTVTRGSDISVQYVQGVTVV